MGKKINYEECYHFSFNFDFADDTRTDTDATGSNVVTSDSQLILNSGTIGTWISSSTTALNTITKVQVKATGENIQDANFFVSADGGTNFLQVTLESLTTIVNQGKLLRLRIDFTTANPRIGSAVVLYS